MSYTYVLKKVFAVCICDYTWQAFHARGVFLGDVCVLLGRSLYLGSVFCGLGR